MGDVANRLIISCLFSTGFGLRRLQLASVGRIAKLGITFEQAV